MSTVLWVNLLVLFLFLFRRAKGNGLLEIAFIVLFFFLALRYDYGNDYLVYLERFQDISEYSDYAFLEEIPQEIGYSLLNYFFKPFGFFTLIAAMSAFNLYSIYCLIRDYVDPPYQWYSVFLYIFTTDFMLVHASAMRQALAISILIWAVRFLLEKRLIFFFLSLGIAACFHKSVLIMLPLPLLTGKWFQRPQTCYWLAGGVLLSFLLARGNILNHPWITGILNYISQYTHYADYYVFQGENAGGKLNSGLGLLANLLIFLSFLVYSYRDLQNNKERFFANIALISLGAPAIGMVLQIAMRLNMYFAIFSLVAYPVAYCRCRDRLAANLFLTINILLTLYGFIQFFKSEIWIEKFSSYQTIFSSGQWY